MEPISTGVSGPDYWGLLNLDWFMCDKGRQQSPIDIDTKSLVYDPHLKPLSADNNLLSGVLINDGHSVILNFSTKLILYYERNELKGQKQHTDNRRRREIVTEDGDVNLATLNLSNLFDSVEESMSKPDSSMFFVDSTKTEPATIGGKMESIERAAPLENGGDVLEPDTTTSELSEEDLAKIQFTGAGLDYPYQLEVMYLRFGMDSKTGSEHKINKRSYPCEIQLLSYNSLLYKSYSDALSKPNGILGIAILVDIQPASNRNISRTKRDKINNSQTSLVLDGLLGKLDHVKYRDSSILVRDFNISALLTDSSQFVSYVGSLTIPGCYESVNWLVLNKALYITQQNINALRSLSADESLDSQTGTHIAGNIRPTQSINNRLVRTNIRPTTNNRDSNTCQRLWTRYQYAMES